MSDSMMSFMDAKPLSGKEILKKIKESGGGKLGFCWNSRRWLIMLLRTPHACPDEKEQMTRCEKCGYFESREPTEYIVYRLRQIRWGSKRD